ncbi:polycystin-1 [Cheilinus undulatus]|uniref:polycystin-1 n=1 Tax=Cheilinus undulatus TaxID=241271 RepID=UPI001BD5BBA6|nr:polycystin-1 [Cheilinus undulatus]
MEFRLGWPVKPSTTTASKMLVIFGRCRVLLDREGFCPKGGRVHLASQQCYWLSEIKSSWPEGQESCKSTGGGEMASTDSLELQTFIFYSFPVRSTEWVWIKGQGGGTESDQAGALRSTNRETPMCSQMALGTQRGGRKAQCTEQHRFLCEKKVSDPLLSADRYLTGLAFLTGIYAQTQKSPLPSVPEIGQQKVEMQLFPGIWFSHAGQLSSVELVVQPSRGPSLARVQILRPYCNPNQHLVPPGCSSLLNSFSCCSAVPLCNTTGGCSRGQYWCYLLEACVCTNCPCSPYDSATENRGFVLPPRYDALPPFYHLVADLPLRVEPSSDLRILRLLLPNQAIVVYPDDIVAVQHTRDSGTFLHCLSSEASLKSPWRQSYLSLQGKEWGGWWEGGLTSLPKEGQWVDGVLCDLRVLYEENLPRGTENESLGFTTAAPESWALENSPTLYSRFGLSIIHPIPDENNQIHAQINVPLLIVVKVLSGENAQCSWSFPAQQTGIPLLPHCPEEVVQFLPDCKRRSRDAWFSSVTLRMPSEGVETLNVSVTDEVSSQNLSVRVCGYKAVTGLSVEPHGCWRMLVDTPQLFTARVESGSSVKFYWVIDHRNDSAHEGESYSVEFKKPAEYKLKNQQILLTADEITPLAEPEFLSIRRVVSVDAAHLYSLRVKADISLPLTFSWDFGDGRSKVVHTKSAPCLSMQDHFKAPQKQVYVQDSVNYTYDFTDDFTLHVQVYNQHGGTDAFMKISTRPKLNHLLVSSSPAVPVAEQTLLLRASPEPFSPAILYTWHFGDGSEAFQSSNDTISHAYASAGVYNITVRANNTLTVLTSTITLEVREQISGLTVSYDGPCELSSPVSFRASLTSGTSVMWEFDFGDGTLKGNLSESSISHMYDSPGNYTVRVSVSNFVSEAHESISVEVYKLAVSGVLPTDCVMSGEDVQLRALVNGNISLLTFYWLFRDESPLTVERGQSTTMHRFQSQGSVHVGLNVSSSSTSVSFSTSICVELGITNVTVQASHKVAAVGEEVCFEVEVSPRQISGYTFRWFRSQSSASVMTKNSQKCFVFPDKGVKELLVVANNRVSNKTGKASVSIQSPVSSLSVVHDAQDDALTVNTSASFWVSSCSGSNVSVMWDFGDGSSVEQGQHVSHVFTSKGQFTVTATAFNTISHRSVTLTVNVLLPVSDLSLHAEHPYAAVGEEMLFSAVSSTSSSSNYYWTVDGGNSTKQGTHRFHFAFTKPGVYEVRVIAQNLVSRREAAILIEVFERIEGLQIKCQSLSNMKYVPTQEELLFRSSVSKGSNVTFHWLATQRANNRHVAGNGDTFQMVSETPGEIFVQLRASNMLSEATTNVSLEAVQRIIIANITKQSNAVALGELVNISVTVAAGSHLEYFWYVTPDISPRRTCVPFLLQTFASLGHYLVKVSVQNVISQCNVSFEFDVQEQVKEVDFDIDGRKEPFYIATGTDVRLHGRIQKGSHLNWKWKVNCTNAMLSSASNKTVIISFPKAGVYQVLLSVSNSLNWQQVSHSVTVLDAIKGLELNTSKSTICANEQVTFVPEVSKGSYATFHIWIENADWTFDQEMFEKHSATWSLPAGTNQVKLKAWNQVSSAEVSTSILVTEQIQGLQLVSCCSADLEPLKGMKFKADVHSGLPVNYTWVFDLAGSEPVSLVGQEVIFTPQESGSLSFRVFATNGVCSKTLNDTCTVHWPLKHAHIVHDSERVFVGHAVRFSAITNGGSNLSYLWNFGDASETLTSECTLSHTYHTPGEYSIVLKVLNSVSHVSTQLHIEVEKLQCSSPKVSLVQPQSTIFRSRPTFFEARVDNNCSAYKTKYLWEIFKGSDGSNASSECLEKKVTLKSDVDTTSPFLFIPKHSLEIGQYCLVFTVLLQGTPLIVERRIRVKVVHSPLVAVIRGGSHRLWHSSSNLVLDGSGSQDPDVEPGVEDALQYQWTMTVVTVCDAHLLPVIVGCVSCSDLFSPHTISYNVPVILSGKCEQCDDKATYEWSAVDETGMTLDLNEVTTSTGRRSANLVIKSDVLQPRRSYTFSLNVSQSGRRTWGSASLTVRPINPPHGGLCDLSPQSNIHLLETLVTYTCSGWQDDESEASQLIYTFQVAPCQPAGPECPLLTLYRGTHSTHGTQVPVGSSLPATNRAVIRVTVQVENYLGAKVIAFNRTLAVEKPAEKVASEWLRNKSQSVWALVQHGNPQEIIPYSIALTSQLNQMDSGYKASDFADRRKIRENVTKALASLPVSSLLDVDQISSALSLSTAVPGEMICRNCQEKVLKAVQKMIHVIQEHMNPGVLSAVEMGRNILAIIGNTLAAVSLNSHQSPPQQASTIFMSALSHAGDLMRSLMRARVYGGTPLSLSNPYVNTVGFHGDPSNLLCTHQSNQNQITSPHWSSRDKLSLSCLFHIPDPLTTHLKAQESEVVQVLFGVDADIGGNSFLTAADPPISTNLVAMELTTPQGQVIPIQDLDPEQAIRVTLPNKHPVGQNDLGEDGTVGGTCPTVTLPTQGQLNFSVKAVDGLDKNAGLYISFTFNHDEESASLSPGHVKIEAGTNTSLDLLEVSLTLPASSSSTEKTVFLSPLSLCQYYSVEERCWSSEGLQPLEGSTPHAAHCLTKHLTLFGASMFVHPGAVVLLPPPSGPVCNMVVGIVCAVLVLIHSLMGLIAHKLDYFNSLRMSQVPLCGQPGLYHYRVLVKTGWQRGAGTTAHVGICLYGVTKSGSRHLQREGAFQRGSLDQFHLETDDNLGEVWKIRIWHDSTGLDPSWYVKHVVVWDPQTDHMFFFLLEDWLAVENQKNSTVEKEVLASCPMELSQFRRVFSSQLMFGMVERHLWLSLWECPAQSRFTRSQRVLCSALMLHLYLALGVLWYRAVGVEGSSEPVSAELLVNVETVAVGMTVALLVFPLQCCLCFLFRKCQSQVAEDVSDLTSPVCYSVEMDVSFDHLGLSGPSFLSFKDSSSPGQGSPSSLLESKVLDSSILDFWSSCGLVPQTVVRACKVEGTEMWQSCDDLPADPYLNKTLPAPTFTKMSPALGRIHQLKRKKALMQLCRSSSSITDPTTASLSPLCTSALSNRLVIADQPPSAQKVSNWNNKSVQAFSNNLTTLLTLSDEDLMMSIAAASEDTVLTKSNSDSGWDSPRTTSSFSNTHSTSCSSWPEENEDKSLYGDVHNPEPHSIPFLSGTGLYKCASVVSVDSMASTFLPNPSPDTSRSCSATRIGVARSVPGWLLPPWAPSVIYPVVALMLGACLTVVGVYSSHMSRAVVLMWLVSVLSAFFTSALLLEPLKVCMQALISTALWRPVDPEVENQLSWKSTVVRMFKEHGGKVRPPCGYGLLQAKEEARKVKALQSLMRHCVCQLIFLMLVLMVNYQDNVEKKQGRLLHSAVRRQLRTAPMGVPNLTSLRDWSDADQWIHHVLIPHLHQSPSLRLVGVPQLQLKHPLSALQTYYLGNDNATTTQLAAELHMETWSKKQLKSLSIDYTHSHRESALLVCVSIQLEWVHAHRLSPLLFIHTFLLPSSNPAVDLQTVLMVLLLISGLLILFGELWTIATERAQCKPQSLFQLLLALLSLATAILHFCFLLVATSCVSEIRSQTYNFINFQSTAFLVRGSSQCAAVLLTLLVLKLLRTLKFVQRWLVFGNVVQRAWRELLTLAVLLVLSLLLCIHLGNTLFSVSVEGFLTAHQTGVLVLSILRGRMTLQRLCRVHPVLGPLYGLIVVIGGVWLLARLCGAVLIHAYRVAQAELYRPRTELQDYEMVMFFIKRLKLRLGLTKTKEFRHRVKFEGMDMPPSRSSCISTLSPSLSCPRSPSLCSSFSSQHPFSSALSLRSDDSAESGIDIQPYLDRLLPCLNSLIFHFDQVNQITEDIHDLEIQLEEAQSRRRKRLISCTASGSVNSTESSKLNEVEEEGRETEEVRHRKTGFIHSKSRVSLPSLHSFAPSKSRNLSASTCMFPRTFSESESDSAPYQPQASNSHHALEAARDAPGSCSLHTAVFPGFGRFQRRRAWHSGSSHSADAVQRIFMTQGGLATSGNGRENVPLTNSRPRSEQGVRRHVSNGVPVKRKAWISEPSETEQD